MTGGSDYFGRLLSSLLEYSEHSPHYSAERLACENMIVLLANGEIRVAAVALLSARLAGDSIIHRNGKGSEFQGLIDRGRSSLESGDLRHGIDAVISAAELVSKIHSSTCLGEYMEQLAREARKAWQIHLDDCDECCSRVAALADES